MTHSQSIAKVFTIIGYIMLIPAVLGVLASFLTASPMIIIPLSLLFFGSWLLRSYQRHWRGDLKEENIKAMWISSAIFNSMLLLPQILFFSQTLSLNELSESIKSSGGYGSIYLSIVIWQLFAIFLSISAIRSELKINRNIDNVP